MIKKKFSLTSDFVKVLPEDSPPKHTHVKMNKTLNNRYTGPNTNRVHYSTSIDQELKSEFKVWVAQKGSDMSTELENAIRLLIQKN